ncbi:5'-AMP-activated protein kinase beta subunit, interation domain-containing protein [Bipolaris maydis]|nr:5'-AMP-activated protein kinase beta subunit, interation domain-containing protein [Bipolaris maydis]KAJ6198559.1 5'-AMP-activated protein kinase beta subunit, interation domain-containing protein [Bipolaris maydis]
MGNQNSRSTTASSNPQSPTGLTTSHGQHPNPNSLAPSSDRSLHPPHPNYHSARRRESIQALSAAKAPAAPSVSLENAESQPSSARPHSRGRAQTIGTSTKAVASQLRAAAHDHFSARHHINNNNTHDAAMGNEQSSHRGHHHRDKEKDRNRDREKENSPRDAPSITTTPPQAAITQQQQQQQQQEQPQPQQPPPPPPPQEQPPQDQHQQPPREPSPTPPVDVPAPPREDADTVSLIDPADASQDYLIPPSQFSRPPRMPLPIEEEVHTPGSPIISPEEIWSPIHENEAEGMLPRRSSMLSTTTADDEDLGEEFKGPSTGRPTVPTLIEWEGPGERVYVTGTFAGWNRKYRLHRNGPSKKKDALSAYVSVTPGTHHLTFLVDNDMRTSDKLPTAVDYTNILVNYIEVPYPEPQPPVASPSKDAQGALDAVTPMQEPQAPPGMYPPQLLPPAPDVQPIKAPLPEPPKPPAPEPTKKYHQNIPRYLLDLDAPEDSSRFLRANAMTNNLPTPPTLPGFLGKSILNGTTPMKDDSSVLIHPNHTVLNHLATSSIKDNILATSATTRYKQKFLTTIMYKPKEEHSEVH